MNTHEWHRELLVTRIRERCEDGGVHHRSFFRASVGIGAALNEDIIRGTSI
jgi:hypothetical protein